MSLPQIALILHALALIGVLSVLVPFLTEQLGGPWGYLASLAFYWVAFCLPVFVFHVRKRHADHLFSERLPWRDWWIVPLLLVQVCAVAVAIFVPNTAMLTTQGAFLAAMFAIVNGPLEEVAWRGGFMTRFADRPRLGFVLSWLLFSAWHWPLLLAHDIVYPGGAMGFALSASALGLLWGWIAWRTGSVFWIAIAHALTNVLTFWVLFNANGFVSPHY